MRYETSAPLTVSSKQVLDAALWRAVSPSVLPPCHPQCTGGQTAEGKLCTPCASSFASTKNAHPPLSASGVGAVGNSSPLSWPLHHSPREAKRRAWWSSCKHTGTVMPSVTDGKRENGCSRSLRLHLRKAWKMVSLGKP